MAERTPAPHRQPVLTWLTPKVDDLLFFVERDARLPEHQKFEFGQAYEDKIRFPGHKLIYVSPQDDTNWSRWYYAADREHQDDYNWEIQNNDTLFRTYLVLRADYPASFAPPEVTTPDTKFAQYVFAGESVERVDKELDSLYVTVRRTFSIQSLVSYQWDDVIQRSVKVTREIVKAGTVTGSKGTGSIVEVQAGDTFYDLKITSEVQWLPGDLGPGGTPVFPIVLDTISADANYQFPLLLKSVKLFGAWAYATSEGAPPSYSEDFFFEIDTVEPPPGPFSATILRFLTNNPEAVRTAYPTAQIVSRSETFGLVKWWAASTDSGNNTFALARQYTTPATVHADVELPAQVNYTQGGNLTGVKNGPGSQKLPATPGFAAFMATATTIAGVDTRRSRFGLWEVQVTRINAGGANLYQGDQNISRSNRPGTGTGDLPLPGQGTGLQVTIWGTPQVHSYEATLADRKMYNAGGVARLLIVALEPFEWQFINSYGGAMSCPEEPSQPATGPGGKWFEFTYGPNTAGFIRNFTVRFQGESGYQFIHGFFQQSD